MSIIWISFSQYRIGLLTAPFGDRILSIPLTVGAIAVASTVVEIFAGDTPGPMMKAGVLTGLSLTGLDVEGYSISFTTVHPGWNVT